MASLIPTHWPRPFTNIGVPKNCGKKSLPFGWSVVAATLIVLVPFVAGAVPELLLTRVYDLKEIRDSFSKLVSNAVD